MARRTTREPASEVEEGKEARSRTKQQAWKPGEAAEGRTPAHQLPHPMPRSATGRRTAHGPGVTTPMVTSAIDNAWGTKVKATKLQAE